MTQKPIDLVEQPHERASDSGVHSRRSLTDVLELAADRSLSADVAGGTHPGCVRPHNEDQFLVAQLERSLLVQHSSVRAQEGTALLERPQGRLMVVADGMGGYEGGEIASATAVDVLAHYAFAVMPWLLSASDASREELQKGLAEAVERAHGRVRQVAEQRGLDARMGTTLTLAYLTWPELLVVHAGDSRAYLLRDGKLLRITRDHTMAQQLVEQKVMSQEEAESSRFNHILVNSVGGLGAVNADFYRVRLEDDDRVLLCSDGVNAHLDDARIEQVLSKAASSAQAVDQLIEEAKRLGGQDNITAVVASFPQP